MQPRKRAPLKILLRMLLLLAYCIPNTCIAVFIPPANNLYVELFFQQFLYTALFFFTLFAFSDMLLLRIGLYDDD